jgi:hypothetical protein
LKREALPKVNSIAASSLCEARQKMPETIFKKLNQALIKLWHEHRSLFTWKNHRVFAIDGSKINVPRGLLNQGYFISKNSARHYPSGMIEIDFTVD